MNPCFKVLIVSFVIFFLTRTVLGSYNVTLNIKYQENQERIRELIKESETLLLDVQNLGNYDRIKTITDNSDMRFNDNNVVNVSN